uniref:AP complex mu/sigma subunit domain-containing protein n=1 Tax=Zonotrichia albicollis TaxID=44394 RepID=A0A8D2LZP6_ZONAL
MRFMLLFSRQGKLRLQKWYLATADKDKKKMVRELMQVVLARKPKMCSFLEWRDLKVVYKRYKKTPKKSGKKNEVWSPKNEKVEGKVGA